MSTSRSLLVPAVTVVLLLTTSLAPTVPAQADGVQQIDRSFQVSGADTVAFELNASGDAETRDGSQLVVTASFDDDPQRVAYVGGLVHEAEGASCPGGGDDACFIDLHAETKEDLAVSATPEDTGDLRADTGPGLDRSVETGHDHARFFEVQKTIDLGNLSFAHEGSYELFVTAPGAAELSVNLDIAVRNITLTNETVTDTGFAHWTDDMRAAGAHTAFTSTYTGFSLVCGLGCGEATVGSSGERVFGAIGPGENGDYTTHNDVIGGHCDECLGPIPAAFVGRWGVDWDGGLYTGTGVGAVSETSPNAAVAPAPGVPAPATFFVQAYASAGPQDLVAAGFVDAG